MICFLQGASPKDLHAYGLANPYFLKIIAIVNLLNQVIRQKLTAEEAFNELIRLYVLEEAIGNYKPENFLTT